MPRGPVVMARCERACSRNGTDQASQDVKIAPFATQLCVHSWFINFDGTLPASSFCKLPQKKKWFIQGVVLWADCRFEIYWNPSPHNCGIFGVFVMYGFPITVLFVSVWKVIIYEVVFGFWSLWFCVCFILFWFFVFVVFVGFFFPSGIFAGKKKMKFACSKCCSQ